MANSRGEKKWQPRMLFSVGEEIEKEGIWTKKLISWALLIARFHVLQELTYIHAPFLSDSLASP